MKLITFFLISFLAVSSLFAEHIPLDSREGMDRLNRSIHTPYLPLKNCYEEQLINYCGIACGVIILNTLGILTPDGSPYTQPQFFTKSVLEITNEATVVQRGVTFEELVDCLNTFPQLGVAGVYADQFRTPEELAIALKQLMSQEGHFVIANFSRKALGQVGGGHYSPLAAFDEVSRSVLILDVNLRRYGSYWVPIDSFWQSMQNIGDRRNSPRGLILCQKQVD